MTKERKPNKEYLDLVHDSMPKTKHVSTSLKAFLVGGLICVIGQGFADLLMLANLDLIQAKTFATVLLVLITAILTGVGVYDKIGLFGGAGSLVPITGFANSVVAPAMEHRHEGIILGLCSNIFKMAGPVIVIGTIISVIVGLVALIFPTLFAV